MECVDAVRQVQILPTLLESSSDTTLDITQPRIKSLIKLAR